MSEDRELVHAVLERAPGAFERLVARHQRLVWHMLARMLPDRSEAEDLSQEVFLRVYRKLAQFRFDCSLSTWVGRIAFSIGARHLQKHRLPLLEPEPDADESVLDRIGDEFDLEQAHADAELFSHVGAAMQSLPPIQRTLLTLYHLDELSIAEIAAIADLPQGTVKNYLHRGRHRLRAALIERIGVAA